MTHTAAPNEGVIKYQLDYQRGDLTPPAEFAEFNAWRRVLWRLGLLGQDPRRYDGLAYGNVSLRLAQGFLISGTQTSQIECLAFDQYVQVLHAQLASNRLTAIGPVPPSSEALTHAAIYQTLPNIQCVAHGHSPALWRYAAGLGWPCIAAEHAYGTPALALAVAQTVQPAPTGGLLALLGHQDGVLAYGENTADVVDALTRALVRVWRDVPGA